MKSRSEIRAALAAAFALGALLAAGRPAHAYCRTAACPTKDVAWQVCDPEQPSDCGTPLYWGNRCVGFTLQKDASSQVALGTAESVFQKAFSAWVNADCGNGLHPSIAVTYQGPVECDAQEYNKKKGNANIITFRDDGWPYGEMTTVLALTTVTYNLETSEIFDADMELNSASIDSFTVGDADVDYDLLSIATHEAGHFLGLAHSKDTEATMFTDYKVGSTWLRDLHPDDVAGICAAYPPTMPRSADCDPEPRHGFSGQCESDQPDRPEDDGGGCAVASCGVSRNARLPGAAALLGALALSALRRRRRRGPARRAAGAHGCEESRAG